MTATASSVPGVATLKAYMVGDMDIFAAYDPAQALALGNEMAGGEGHGPYDLDDVNEVDAAQLDWDVVDEDGNRDDCLRVQLSALTEPGYMMSTE